MGAVQPSLLLGEITLGHLNVHQPSPESQECPWGLWGSEFQLFCCPRDALSPLTPEVLGTGGLGIANFPAPAFQSPCQPCPQPKSLSLRHLGLPPTLLFIL